MPRFSAKAITFQTSTTPVWFDVRQVRDPIEAGAGLVDARFFCVTVRRFSQYIR